LQRTFKYASLLRISGALHLGIFDQPEKISFSRGSIILTKPLFAKGVVGEERPLKISLTKNPHPGIQLRSKISIWLEFCFKGLPKK